MAEFKIQQQQNTGYFTIRKRNEAGKGRWMLFGLFHDLEAAEQRVSWLQENSRNEYSETGSQSQKKVD